jgi:hypothetical protein
MMDSGILMQPALILVFSLYPRIPHTAKWLVEGWLMADGCRWDFSSSMVVVSK